MDRLKLEGFVQRLRHEVENISQLTQCMDAFNESHTRLVVIADGLDSCEQDKLLRVRTSDVTLPLRLVTSLNVAVISLQVLDMVHQLFSENESPFVSLLAVDPHVVVKGIEANLHVNLYLLLHHSPQLPPCLLYYI